MVFVAALLVAANALTAPDSCQSSFSYGQKCKACNGVLGYFDNGYGGCSLAVIENCAYIKSDGCCGTCAASFVLRGCGCKLDRSPEEHCYQYKRSSRGCAQCQAGFVSVNGVCQAPAAPITRCRWYGGEGECRFCETGYFLFENTCHAGVANCMASSGPVCESCQPGFALKASKSSLFRDYATKALNFQVFGVFDQGRFTCDEVGVAHCTAYAAGNAAQCTACAENFVLQGNTCAAVVPIENCNVYASPMVCAECAAGFYPSAGACQSAGGAIAHCIYYAAAAQCGRCAAGFFVSGGACQAVPTVLANCAVYGNVGACEFCETGFFLAGGECRAALTSLANCARQTVAGCEACRAGFFLADGACQAAELEIEHCGRYASATACQLCGEGFHLRGPASCLPIVSVAHCEVLASATACRFCESGFFEASGACEAVTAPIAHCLFYASATSCAECAPGYAPTDPTRAVCGKFAPDHCLSWKNRVECGLCENGFYWEETTLTCEPATPILHCTRYHNATQCAGCAPPYLMVNNTCVSFVVDDWDCLELKPFYHDWVGDQADCAKCGNKSYIGVNAELFNYNMCVDMLPVAFIPNCASYLNGTNFTWTACSECVPGYYVLPDHTCTPSFHFIEHCASYDEQGACARCDAPFAPNGTHCLPVDTEVAHCFSYSAAGACEACSTGWWLLDGTCLELTVAPVAHCALYDADGCAQCATGFFLDGPACTAVETAVDNCEAYATATACAQCLAPFILDQNACRAPGAAHCLYMTGPFACGVCEPGFAPSAGVCVAVSPLPHCAEMADADTCAHCESTHADPSICAPRAAGVADCLVHDSATTCSVCENGKFFANGACIPVTASVSGCLSYVADGVCRTCSSGVPNADGSACFAGCHQAGPVDCLVCQPGLLLTAGACGPVADPVANCDTYNEDETCARCLPDFALSPSGTCQSFAGLSTKKCAAAKTPFCQICKPGFFLTSEGICEAVAQTLEGCHIYSKDGTKCSVCDSHHFQKFLEGPCLELPQKPDCFCYNGENFGFDFK